MINNIRKSKGFTLLELMVVVAIVGILASIAIPSYAQYVIRAGRADAKVKLTDVMFEMERFNTRNRTYTATLTELGFAAPLLSDNGLYTISAAACGNIRTCVVATATPVAGTTQDGDGNLTLNSRGTRVGKW